MNTKICVIALISAGLLVVCFCVVFIGNNQKTTPANHQQDDSIKRIGGNDSSLSRVTDDSTKHGVDRKDTPPPVAVDNTEKDQLKERIEKAFSEFENTEVPDSNYMSRARSLAKLAQEAPEFIVQKLLSGNKETQRRALSVMYSFHGVGADASRLVFLLEKAYRQERQDMQICIIFVLKHLRSNLALPLLREILDDKTNQPPGRPGVEQPYPPHRMCDFSYAAVLEILKNKGIEHGLKDKYGRATDIQLEEMKAWLDSHPKLLNSPTNQKQEEEKKK